MEPHMTIRSTNKPSFERGVHNEPSSEEIEIENHILL